MEEALSWNEKHAILNMMQEIGLWEVVGTKRVGNLQGMRRPRECDTCKLLGMETKTSKDEMSLERGVLLR